LPAADISDSQRDIRTFQGLLLALNDYWGGQGCVLLQPYDMEVGAGTFHPDTFLRAIGPEPWGGAHPQPARRPADGRYGENPNRLQHYYQYQVTIKPSPLNIQDGSASTPSSTTFDSSKTTGNPLLWAPGGSAGKCG